MQISPSNMSPFLTEIGVSIMNRSCFQCVSLWVYGMRWERGRERDRRGNERRQRRESDGEKGGGLGRKEGRKKGE